VGDHIRCEVETIRCEVERDGNELGEAGEAGVTACDGDDAS
jgi:hypothetical protein